MDVAPLCHYCCKNVSSTHLSHHALKLKIIKCFNGIAALLHEPLGRTRGTTDANGVDAFEPLRINFFRSFYLKTVGIDALAFAKKYLAVAALMSTDKEYKVVAGGECFYVGHAIGHLTTDGVERLEGGSG